MSAPRRICSLLPSATEIIAQLGGTERLVGVSEECRWPPEVVGTPVVSTARIDLAALTSAEIDRLVRDSTRDGRSLYTVDAQLIDELQPDLIVTQDLCTVCAVSSDDLTTACPVDAEVLSLDPRTVADVAATVRRRPARARRRALLPGHMGRRPRRAPGARRRRAVRLRRRGSGRTCGRPPPPVPGRRRRRRQLLLAPGAATRRGRSPARPPAPPGVRRRPRSARDRARDC